MGYSRVRYTRTAVVLHWLIALCVLGQIAFGWYLQDIPRGSPARSIDVNLHKSIGLTIGLLILFRLGWRLTHRAPALPPTVPAWERIASQTTHIGLYACMLLMPTTGYIASNFSRWGINLFNSIKIAPWGPDDKTLYAIFNGTHVITSYVLVVLICVHILAALRHLALRDGIFARMLPARGRSTSEIVGGASVKGP